MAPKAASSHLGTRNGASLRMKLTQKDGKKPGLLDILKALDRSKVIITVMLSGQGQKQMVSL